MDEAEHREVDVTIVVHQIAIHILTLSAHVGIAAVLAIQAEWLRCLGVGSLHHDGQLVFRHNLGIIELTRRRQIQRINTLEVHQILNVSTPGKHHCHNTYHGRDYQLFHIILPLNFNKSNIWFE